MSEINWRQFADQKVFQVFNVINGKTTDCLGELSINKNSPRNGKLLYRFAQGNGQEVNEAVVSAREVFNKGAWKDLPINERKQVLFRLADLIEKYKEEFALYDCLDVGKPISYALCDDVVRAIASIKSAAEYADKILAPSGSDEGIFAYQQYKPVGVVAGIVGWNYPLSLAASKVGPALAMGNSVVLKPSEYTPLSACRLAELALEAGVPDGVFNVVNGVGNIVGDTLACHPDVDLLTFVGSSATGKQLMISSGQSNMKRLILECGGKSPYLIFDDCPDDLDSLAADIVATAFPNQGALCVAGTRLLVQPKMKDDLLQKIFEHTRKLVPDDPLNADTIFGAIMNEAHMDKILDYINLGEKQGSELIYGGKQVNQDTGGYYIQPTVFDHVDPNSTIAQEEIFGPVLSIINFDNEEQAINLANNSRYGLAAYAATKDLSRAIRLGQRLNSGILGVVGTNTLKGGAIGLTFEGHRQSGFGSEGGIDGMKAYTVSTTVNLFV